MKLILIKDVSTIGHEGDVIDVSEGYGRNYLLPKKLAVIADTAALNILEKNKKRIDQKRAEKMQETAKLAEKLDSLSLEIKADAGEAGRLFGSITNADIAAELKRSESIEIDKKKIIINEAIKTLGEHLVSARLAPDIEATIKINVIASK